MSVQTISPPSGHVGPQQKLGYFIQEPPLPPNIQWPPFVPAAPRQIDCVLYMVTLAPTAIRHETFDQELTEYITLKQQARAIERSLLEEHQLMLNPPFQRKRDGSSDYQWKRPANAKDVMADRDIRIRRLECVQLDLRLRRARLEVSLLESEIAATDKRMAESISRRESLPASSPAPSISATGTSSPLYLQGAPSLYLQGSPSVTVGHRSVSKSPHLNRPEAPRKRF